MGDDLNIGLDHFAADSRQVPRIHPLAFSAFALSLLGIPLFGLLTGAMAVILAGVCLGQIAGNPLFRGRGLAFFSMVLGLADMVLWVWVLGFVVPRMGVPADWPMDNMISSSVFHEPAPGPIQRALESNVFLVVERTRRPSFLGTESFSGSGVILGEKDGEFLILTNRHVVDPSFVPFSEEPLARQGSLRVHFYNGSVRAGRVWWVDPRGVDLALVATGRTPEKVAFPPDAAGDLQVGARVFAVGNPHELSWTYTEGVISGIRGTVKAPFHLRIIQTQAPINQGNSGGGLYAMDGTLLGIVSWTKDKAVAEGISFAIAYRDFLALFYDNAPEPAGQ